VAAGAALTLLALALGACGKRNTLVDPDYVFPEGNVSVDAQLVIWPEAAVQVLVYGDIAPPGPDRDPFCPARLFPGLGDPLLRIEIDSTAAPTGSINMAILDHTPASSFRPMRRETNGGYRAPLDFPIRPSRKWLESQWELYGINDSRPSGFQPPTYVARGVIGNSESADSPLTNEARLERTAIDSVAFTASCLPCDSLFTLSWEPVPGAVRYWLHVFQLSPGVSDGEIRRATRPAPLNSVRARDYFLGFVDNTVTSYKLGQYTRTDVTRLVERITNYNQEYQVRIAAVDSLGQLIAITKGDYRLLDRDEGYGLVRLNSVLVVPKKITDPLPPACRP
jgi:hypothetical protein